MKMCVTKPMVWVHSGPWTILGHIFVLLRNVYCGGYFGQQVCMAYVTKRKIALLDAKQDPKMGQLNSPWSTYGESANYTNERACMINVLLPTLVYRIAHILEEMH